MDSFFRAVAIGLGVLMGTFNPGVEPELQATVHKADGVVLVAGDLKRAVSPKMEEALQEGVPMALTLEAVLDERTGPPLTKVLTYLPLARQWQVSRVPGETKVFATMGEAEREWLRWSELSAGAAPSGPFTLAVRATLSFPGRPEWKADMVWKAPVVTWSKAYSRLSEIPY